MLNKPAYRKAQILVTGDNFGCGSSREHAPWALLDFGIRCVIAPDFADIFYNNCFQNGILPIRLPQADVDKLMDDAKRGANATLTDRPREAGNPRAGRRRDQVRHRSLPQALPAERPRQHRPDAGEGKVDPGIRKGHGVLAALAVVSFSRVQRITARHHQRRHDVMAKTVHMMVRVLEEARSVDFYSRAFGLEIADRVDFDGFTLIYLRNAENDFEVELTVNKGRTEAYNLGDGYGHVAFVVDDLAAEHARLMAAGLAPGDLKQMMPRRRAVRPLLLHRRSRRLQDRSPAARRPLPLASDATHRARSARLYAPYGRADRFAPADGCVGRQVGVTKPIHI